jgi:hypothetical protein
LTLEKRFSQNGRAYALRPFFHRHRNRLTEIAADQFAKPTAIERTRRTMKAANRRNRTLTEPTISLRIAGETRTIELGNRGYVHVDETIAKATLDADPTTEARSMHAGFTNHQGPQPAGECVQTGVFEPAARHPRRPAAQGPGLERTRDDALSHFVVA